MEITTLHDIGWFMTVFASVGIAFLILLKWINFVGDWDEGRPITKLKKFYGILFWPVILGIGILLVIYG